MMQDCEANKGWQHRGMEEATWEYENTMRARYPFLFKDEGTWFSHLEFE